MCGWLPSLLHGFGAQTGVFSRTARPQGNYSDLMVKLSAIFSQLRGDQLAEAQGGSAQVSTCPSAIEEWMSRLVPYSSCAHGRLWATACRLSTSKHRPICHSLHAGLQALHHQVLGTHQRRVHCEAHHH